MTWVWIGLGWAFWVYGVGVTFNYVKYLPADAWGVWFMLLTTWPVGMLGGLLGFLDTYGDLRLALLWQKPQRQEVKPRKSQFMSDPDYEPPEPLPKTQQAGSPLAWRAWTLKKDVDGLPVLTSTAVRYDYEGPRVMNEGPPVEEDPFRWHARTKHMIGTDRELTLNEFGFYSHKSLSQIETYLSDYCRIVGQVELLGTIIEHENGYRSQGMVIRKLRLYPGGWGRHWEETRKIFTTDAPAPWLPEDSYGEEPKLVRILEERYRCDVEWVTEEPEGSRRSRQSNWIKFPTSATTTSITAQQFSNAALNQMLDDLEEDLTQHPLYPSVDIHKPKPEDIQRYGGQSDGDRRAGS